MIVCYDPVAREVTLHGEDGLPRYEAREGRLVAKHYQDEGIFVCVMQGRPSSWRTRPSRAPSGR